MRGSVCFLFLTSEFLAALLYISAPGSNLLSISFSCLLAPSFPPPLTVVVILNVMC